MIKKGTKFPPETIRRMSEVRKKAWASGKYSKRLETKTVSGNGKAPTIDLIHTIVPYGKNSELLFTQNERVYLAMEVTIRPKAILDLTK